MNQISFTLLLNSNKISIPARFGRLADVSTDIYNTLIFSDQHEYQIKSKVSEEVLRSFIQYWVRGTVPDIHAEDITEYYDLSNEFNLLKDQIQQADNLFTSNLMYFNGLQRRINSDSTFWEEKISNKLDSYLDSYGQELMKLPIQTLYNIFSHSKRVLTNHNLAYSLFIQEYQRSHDPNIFILLTKLDGTLLNQQNLNDCISNRKSRFGNMPIIKRKKETEAKFHKLSETINQQQTKINQLTTEISSIKEKENEIENIKKTIKTSTNQIETIEKKYKEDFSKIEDAQNKKVTTIQNLLNKQEQKISNLKQKHSEDIEKVERQLNKNKKEMKKLSDDDLKLPSRIQTTRKFNKKEHHKKNPNKAIDILYDSTESGRFRGIIHYLTEECGGNVHDNGAVKVTSSSVIPVLPILPGLPIIDDEEHLPIFAADLDNENSSFISDIRPNSWICYDFIDAKVKPNAYSIRSYTNGLSFIQNWRVEGSNDQVKWTVLDERKNEHSIEDSGKSNTFMIKNENVNNFYQFIRLKQIGMNCKDNDSLCISAFELFGKFYE